MLGFRGTKAELADPPTPSSEPAIAEVSRGPKELNRSLVEPVIGAPRRQIAANSRLLSHGQSGFTLRLVGLAATRQYLTESRARIQDAYERLFPRARSRE
jgi:hypothetical protein